MNKIIVFTIIIIIIMIIKPRQTSNVSCVLCIQGYFSVIIIKKRLYCMIEKIIFRDVEGQELRIYLNKLLVIITLYKFKKNPLKP